MAFSVLTCALTHLALACVKSRVSGHDHYLMAALQHTRVALTVLEREIKLERACTAPTEA